VSDAPKDYAFDLVNADAVLNVLQVKDGNLTTLSGQRYRVLQLGGTSQRMTVPVLRKIRDFVLEGAAVVGPPPLDSPSLADRETEFRDLVRQLWGNDGKGGIIGRVHGTGSVEAALLAENIAPDFTYSRPQTDTHLMSHTGPCWTARSIS